MKILTIKFIDLRTTGQCVVFLLSLTFLISCDDFVEVEAPKNELIGSMVFTDSQTAEAALTGIYSRMTENFGGFANSQTTVLAGLYADELNNYSTDPSQIEFYENGLTPNNSNVQSLWSEPYEYIYQANAIIEGLKVSDGITVDLKDQLIGEALFIRAFCHFYLVTFFGDIPYITTTDYVKNSKVSRMSVDEVYKLIVEDLNEAITILSETYISDGRVRPNGNTARAMLARAYLYMGDWANAEKLSDKIIRATDYYQLESDLNQVFLKDSQEAIWQLRPVMSGLNTVEGSSLIFTSVPYHVALSSKVLETFEDNDLRKEDWIGIAISGEDIYYFPYKYQVFFSNTLTEYYMILRLAEQYLIRAESRAQLNNLDGALTDLNKIRNRAGLENLEGTSKEMVLEAIYKERQREFFAEWGHRWFDLKRTGRADKVLSPIKPGWQNTDVLFPIPQSELQNNPNMGQNPGY